MPHHSPPPSIRRCCYTMQLGLGLSQARCVLSQRCSAPWKRCHVNAGHQAWPQRLTTKLRAGNSYEEIAPVPPYMMAPLASADELEQEGKWVSDMVRCWLNDEWAPLEVHTDLGEAAGRAYTKLRAQGQQEAGDLVLGIASELLSFNFRETFVNAFEVSNKVVELLMMREGCEVCCADNTQIQRYEEMLQE